MKIAIFVPNWIGDVVMATPAMRALRNHYPEAHIVGVMKPYVRDVLDGTTLLDETIFSDTKGKTTHSWYQVVKQLRRHRPEFAVLFPNSFRTAVLAWLGNCHRRIGYRRYGRSLLLTDKLEPIRDEAHRVKPSPVLDAYNKLAETAGCPNPGAKMELATTPTDEHHADAVWHKCNLTIAREVICFNPGAAFGSAKHWPTTYFADVARRLTQQRNAAILVLCGPNERDTAREIVHRAATERVHALADFPLSIGLTKACVRRCDLLITTDSGPRHFAAAFDKPVVSLFGPTHIPWTITYHPKEIYLQKDVPCGPCQQRVCPLDHRCMTELVPDEVMTHAVQLLEKFPSCSRDRKAS